MTTDVATVRPTETSVVARRVGALAFGLFASEDYLRRHPPPRHPAELAAHRLVGLEGRMGHSPEMAWLASHGVRAWSCYVPMGPP